MTARATLVVLLACSGLAPLAAVEVSRDVRFLPQRREILIPDSARVAGRWIEIQEDDVLAAGSGPTYADLRIVDEAGVSVPYAARPLALQDEHLHPMRDAEITWSEGHVGPGHVIDLGAVRAEDLALYTSVPMQGIRVEGSKDRRSWRLLRPRWDLYETRSRFDRARQAGRARVQSSHLAYLGAPLVRYLRLTPGANPDLAVTADVIVYRRALTDAPHVDAPFRVTSTRFRGRTWEAIVELEGPPREVSGVRFDAGPELELRPVRIDVKTEKTPWRTVSPGEGTREGPAGTLRWAPATAAAVRVHIDGADPPNAPVEVERLLASPMRFVFRMPRDDARVWVAYGDRHLAESGYDIDRRTMLTASFTTVGLGAEEASPWFGPPASFLEWIKRRPAVVTGAMVAVLALLAGLVWRWRGSSPA